METATYYDVERYSSFDVDVVFEGKNRKYKALVLNHGSTDNPKLEFWDTITGMGGNLTQVWKEQVLPYGIINKSDNQIGTIHNNDKFVAKIRRFLTSSGKDIYADNKSFVCPNNSKELRQCCIASTLAEFWEIDACNAWDVF